MEAPFTISSILFIVTLIVPGIIFKRFYYQGQFTKQFGAGLFADRLITSIFWGIFVQIITFLIYSRSFGFTFINIKQKIDIAYSKIADNKLPDITDRNLIHILGYLGLLVIIAVLLGHLSHNFVRYFKLDIRFNVLRFANRWNYLIKGDILSTREFRGSKKGQVLTTMVDIILDDATEKNKMITGFLTDYIISEKTGELETICLTAAQKYSQTEKVFKDIPGDCLIIPCDRMINMNLRYNIKVVDNIKKKQFINKTIRTFFLIGILIIIIYPWYLNNISIVNKIMSIIFSLFSWLSLIVVISVPFEPKSNAKLNKDATIVLIVFALIFGYSGQKWLVKQL